MRGIAVTALFFICRWRPAKGDNHVGIRCARHPALRRSPLFSKAYLTGTVLRRRNIADALEELTACA